MKKICFFSGDITRSGGTEKISVLLANQLVKRNYDICFISLTESSPELYFKLAPEIKHYKLFNKNIPLKFCLFPAIIKLHNFIKNQQIDIIIDIDVILSLISIAAVCFTKCRQISWEHFHFYENLGCKIRDTARKLAKKYADAIVVLTETDKKQYNEIKSTADIVCIHNAIELPDKVYSKTFNSKTILSVGRLEYQKGFERLPALAERIFKDFPDWQWLIIGDGSLKESIAADIKEKNLQNKLILCGTHDPFEYYNTAAFLVSVSRYEGMPLVLLEALNCQCPVISFDCKHGPADIIQNDINGYLVDAEDFSALEEKIRKLMDSPELLTKFSNNALPSVQDFSVDTFTGKWQELINKI